MLEYEGARAVAVEFHSLSKTYNMTGWRAGMAVGNAEVVRLLGQVKTNVDSGIFQAVQLAAIEAMEEPPDWLAHRNAVLRGRHVMVREALAAIGIDVPLPRATFYLWARVPAGYDSIGFPARVPAEVRAHRPPR